MTRGYGGGDGLRIRIEIDDGIDENEIVIRCGKLDNEVMRIQSAVKEMSNRRSPVFYKGGAEYYLDPEEILFFETSDGAISAHTADDVYSVKSTLYELEGNLPGCFIRISKSAILNVGRIYSIERNLTSSSCVRFAGTHKQAYVSRNYYKAMRDRLEEYRK